MKLIKCHIFIFKELLRKLLSDFKYLELERCFYWLRPITGVVKYFFTYYAVWLIRERQELD